MDLNTLEKRLDDQTLLLDKEINIIKEEIQTEKQKEKNQNSPSSNNNQSPDETLNFDTFFMIRCFLVLLGITFLSLNTIFGFFLPHDNVNCLVDKVHILFGGINEYFIHHNTARHFLIIMSSICVDFIAVFTCIHWTCYGKSWRIMLSLVLFYGFRSLVQVIKNYL
jgi:hypothetical protein